ncbi:MAG: efflux RND transporter periplasmic adaptor subunit [Pseudomonadota bacterium]
MASLFKQIALLAVLAAVAAGAAMHLGAPGDGEAGAQARRGRPPAMVEAAPVRQARVERAVAAVGTGRPVRSVELRVRDDGRVEQVLFSDGETVEEGRPLVRLDDATERAELNEAEAAVEEARAAYERAEALRAQGRVTGSVYEVARAELARMEARRSAAAARLERRTLDAPFTGVMGFSDIEPGAFATPATPVATLDDLSALDADFSVPERFFADVRVGRKVRATTRALPDVVLQGEVVAVDRRVNENTRAFRVRARFENPEQRLPGGLFMRVELVLEARDGLLVPEEALVPQGGALILYVLDEDDRARRRVVTVGSRRAGEAEILDGVALDERVIVRGVQKVRDGAPVRLADPQTDAGSELEAGRAPPSPA